MRTHALRALLALLSACGSPPQSGAAGGPAADTPAPPPPVACSRDLDCVTCPERGCTCGVARSCPPAGFGCAGDPCTDRSGRCRGGRCELVRTAAGPCGTDADCEVRDDDCTCSCYAALTRASSSAMPRCTHSCGTRPRCSDYHARCEGTTHRCLLEVGPAPEPTGPSLEGVAPLRDFVFRHASADQGARLREHDTLVVRPDGTLELTNRQQRTHRIAHVPPAEIDRLARLLATPWFLELRSVPLRGEGSVGTCSLESPGRNHSVSFAGPPPAEAAPLLREVDRLRRLADARAVQSPPAP